MTRTVKVAVIGSGLAGLTAAWLLSSSDDEKVHFEVHLFEKAAVLGMDSSSVSLPNSNGAKEWRVDVPMRSFQGGYYPELIALYKQLGVNFRQSDFSYSFSLLSWSGKSLRRRISTTILYNGASGRAGVSMPSVLKDAHLQSTQKKVIAATVVTFCQFLLSTALLVICYVRMIILACPLVRSKRTDNMRYNQWAEESIPKSALAKWLRIDTAWINFTHDVLVPLFSAVCTASREDVMAHPVEEMLDYIWLTLGTHHYVVVNGVRDVVTRLTTTVPHIHLSSPIASICVDPKNQGLASIRCGAADVDHLYAGFHHVIFATQANHAVPLLTSYASSLPPKSPFRAAVEKQIQCLSAFTYSPTIVINHTDNSLLPDDPRDRRDLNLVCLDPESLQLAEDMAELRHCVPTSYTMATHVLPGPPGYSGDTVFQTTNPFIEIPEKSVLSMVKLDRAVLTMQGKHALKGLQTERRRRRWHCSAEAESQLGDLQGAGRLGSDSQPGIWICGSFASSGIPLLEGCVKSARLVVEQGIWASEGVIPNRRTW